MQERTTGIVLRTRPLTETSLIVQWLTPDLGRLATVAKGARRPKSPFHGKLDLFYRLEFSFARSRRSELHTLREVSLLDPYLYLRRKLRYLQQATYAAELIERTTETETPLPALYQLLLDLLAHLPLQPPTPRSMLAFEIKLLNELGLKPDLPHCQLGAGSKLLLERLGDADWPVVGRVKLSEAQTSEIRQFLQGFLVYHLDRLPAGRVEALREGEEV